MDLFLSVVFILIFVVGILYSIIFHEIAHGLVARWWGDDTAQKNHRLSLNPLAHIDPLGTILVPIFMYLSTGSIFGWAKPVPINPHKFHSWHLGNLTVSLAGITANILLAILLVLVSLSFRHDVLIRLIVINLFLAFFNLLPIPPLDGFRIIMSFLPQLWQEKIEPYLFPVGIVLIIVFLNTPLFSWLINNVLGKIASLLAGLYGI